MIKRHLLATLRDRLRDVPAVVFLGPRQVGKDTGPMGDGITAISVSDMLARLAGR